jgi:hypothetical protein
VPRYLVERTFSAELRLPVAGERPGHVELNTDEGVTWLHSYVSADAKRSYCVCDAPTPEAIRRAATRNRLPVDRITEIRLLDPYLHA